MGKFSFPLFFCIVILAVSFAATLAASLSVPLPIGSDTLWHLGFAEQIYNGDVVGVWSGIIEQNRFPYGLLLFHCLESLLFYSGNALLAVKVLQVFLLPLTLGLTMLLVYKFASPKAAVYTGMFLFGSWAFFDGALQVRPESLDLLLYPLVVGAVFLGYRWRFVGLVAVGVYSHGLAALSMYYGVVVAKLKDRRWRLAVIVGVLVLLPVLVTSLLFVGGAFEKWGGTPINENPQEYMFWSDPVGFIPYYVGAGLLALPFVFKRNKTELARLALFGLVGNLVMLPLWADRFLHYAALPLAIIGGVGLTQLQNPKYRYYYAMALLAVYVTYTISYFGFSFGWIGKWWQPGI